MLTTDTETPVVTETTVSADLLQALEIITELGVDTVSKDLGVLAIDNVALTVEEPLLERRSVRHLESAGKGFNIRWGSCRR